MQNMWSKAQFCKTDQNCETLKPMTYDLRDTDV